MRSIRLATLVLLWATGGVIACAKTAAPRVESEAVVGTAPPTAGLDVNRLEAEIVGFEASDRTARPAPGGILFVGSSSIRLWQTLAADFPGLPVLNRGFGGSTLLEVNHYASRIVLPYRPRLIVLYGGDNEIAMGRTAPQVANDYRAFVQIVHSALPETHIVFISVKPSPSRWAFQETVRETNRLVRAITASDPRQTFVDVFNPMLNLAGRPKAELFIADSLHMTPLGYAIWRRQLTSVVR
jgi:lysophospholipase L1-like esterase